VHLRPGIFGFDRSEITKAAVSSTLSATVIFSGWYSANSRFDPGSQLLLAPAGWGETFQEAHNALCDLIGFPPFQHSAFPSFSVAICSNGGHRQAGNLGLPEGVQRLRNPSGLGREQSLVLFMPLASTAPPIKDHPWGGGLILLDLF